ncbi:YrhB domain-containing protein [Streptomyces sp. NPDC056704]|uniref:YrhB domain-containing protein n=1 Tax=Streptomyces sp. NPDC056704 TaxID=3345917 RepID=UPI0036D12F93
MRIVEPTDWRGMMEQEDAMQLAVAFLARSQRDDEPPLAIDAERVRESNGLLIVPYNSAQYLASRDPRQQLLDCWPILIDLDRGDIRFGTLDERHLWKNPTT